MVEHGHSQSTTPTNEQPIACDGHRSCLQVSCIPHGLLHGNLRIVGGSARQHESHLLCMCVVSEAHPKVWDVGLVDVVAFRAGLPVVLVHPVHLHLKDSTPQMQQGRAIKNRFCPDSKICQVSQQLETTKGTTKAASQCWLRPAHRTPAKKKGGGRRQ
jgi:hypothetical protein